MPTTTKIDFRYRRIEAMGDVTDLVAMLFPGNRNQQHAAARILLKLKAARGILPRLAFLENRHGISRRTLQRTRAKLSRMGLIERVSWMNKRYHGQAGWKISSRMTTALRAWADKIDRWRTDGSPNWARKDEQLVELLQ